MLIGALGVCASLAGQFSCTKQLLRVNTATICNRAISPGYCVKEAFIEAEVSEFGERTIIRVVAKFGMEGYWTSQTLKYVRIGLC